MPSLRSQLFFPRRARIIYEMRIITARNILNDFETHPPEFHIESKIHQVFFLSIVCRRYPRKRPSGMQEAFLHYIWQYQYFDKHDLRTVQGDELQVIRPGLLNTHAGPDFSDAKVKIGAISWAGSVEVHIRSSEWKIHRHDTDRAYDTVVLHVVWEDDKPVVREDGTVLPAVELRSRIPNELVLQYRKLLDSGFRIPCMSLLPSVPDIVRNNMLDRALVERLEMKSLEIGALMKLNNGDWEETSYQLLARNFGFKVNAGPFFMLARNLPYRLLQKHIDRPIQVEAMLFGVAGFLAEKAGFEYHRELRREYDLLRKKYRLDGSQLNVSQWKFLRLRPANFPTLRLAQFASLLIHRRNIFSRMIETTDLAALKSWFSTPHSEFWKTHYSFKKRVRERVSTIGESSIGNIAINTVAPFLVAYGRYKDDEVFMARAEHLLRQVGAEDNNIIRTWSEAGWEVKNAFDSQALIQLFSSYCIPRQCLNCSIGAALLKPSECLSGSRHLTSH